MRLRVVSPIAAGVAALVFAASLTAAPTVFAQPTKDIAQVSAELEALQTRAETASENYNEAQVKFNKISKRLAAAQSRVDRAKVQQAKILSTTNRIAASAYMAGGGGLQSSLGLLLSDNPTGFLEQAVAVQQVSRSQNTSLRRIQTAQLSLAQAEIQLSQQKAAAAAAKAEMAKRRSDINSAVADTEKLLSSLKAEERKRLGEAAARARAASAAAAASARARVAAQSVATDNSNNNSSSSSDSNNNSSNDNGGGSNGGGSSSSRAMIAVNYALSQVGKPYSYNAQPPYSWDCSKLTAAAWARAGVYLTALSWAQANEMRHVSTNDLQPGDILFYFNGAHHVAMYIGGGMIVEAASPRSGVQVTSAWNRWSSSHFSFAGRPLG
ncbi:MAG: NlpC/P60 family protein [Actinomycetes bacterium]